VTIIVMGTMVGVAASIAGVYLPLATMSAIFVGGLVRRIVERRSAHDKPLLQRRREGGILFGSGLVGEEGLTGVGIAAYASFTGRPTPVLPDFLAWLESYPQHLLNLIPVALLVWLLWRAIHAGEGH
jgi:hypothetical protein